MGHLRGQREQLLPGGDHRGAKPGAPTADGGRGRGGSPGPLAPLSPMVQSSDRALFHLWKFSGIGVISLLVKPQAGFPLWSSLLAFACAKNK